MNIKVQTNFYYSMYLKGEYSLYWGEERRHLVIVNEKDWQEPKKEIYIDNIDHLEQAIKSGEIPKTIQERVRIFFDKIDKDLDDKEKNPLKYKRRIFIDG